MDLGDFWDIFEGFEDLGNNPEILGMLVIGVALIYLGIARRLEPLLLIPIGTGIILANLPLGESVSAATGETTGGFLWYFYEYALFNGLIPLLIFLGLGALTDFEPLLARPRTFLLGAAAQFGMAQSAWAGVTQLAECQLAMLVVVSSNLIARSTKLMDPGPQSL